MRTFSVRYWIQTTPLASRSGSGESTISLGGGSFSIGAYGVAPRTSLALRDGPSRAACGGAISWARPGGAIAAMRRATPAAAINNAMRFIVYLLLSVGCGFRES